MDYIVSPIVGAVIGYFTNWLAIKMIFKPHTEKRIFNIRVPFTPGLMPKERYVLSKKVGNIISTHLLTEEVMVNALISDDIHNKITNVIDKSFDRLKQEEKTLIQIFNYLVEASEYKGNDLMFNIGCKSTDIIIKFLKNDSLHYKIIDYIIQTSEKLLKTQAKDIQIEKINAWIEKTFADYGLSYINSTDFERLIKENINKWIDSLNDDTKIISDIIPTNLNQNIKSIVRNKTPDISKLLLDTIQNPKVEEKLKEFLVHLINENVGKLLTIFVNPLRVSESILTSLKNYLADENNYEKTSEMIIFYFNKLLIINTNEVVAKIPEEYRDFIISDSIIKIIRKIINEENSSKVFKSINENVIKLDNKNLYEIILNIEPNIIQITKAYLKEQLEHITNNLSLQQYINKFVSNQIDNVMNMTIKNISNKVTESNLNVVKSIVIKIYDIIIKKAMVNILKSMNISKIVEDRINAFKIEEAEEIVLEVVKKELNAITMVGALLGFIIGCLPLILN